MKIDRHISNLLYDHDCVIVPEMGGFLSSYSAAKIHSVQHVLSPPSKKIAFNIFLKHNDGLLTDYVARREGLTYNEALKEIRGYVEQYHQELEMGKRFNIEQVGVLSMDSEGNILFEPSNDSNYLRTSFGFSSIPCFPLAGETAVEKGERIKARPPVRINREIFSKSKRRNIANPLLLIGSILWFAFNIYIVSPSYLNFASLNPFADTIIHHPIIKNIPAALDTSLQKSEAVETLDMAHSHQDIEEETPSSHEAGKLSTDSSFKGIESEPATDSFFLIAGAFRSMNNATRMKEELVTLGFSEASVIENKNGFNMVSYNSFRTQHDAYEALKRLKEEKGAWVYSAK